MYGKEGGGLNIYIVHCSVYSTINIGRELWNKLYICPCDKKIMLGVIKMYGREGGELNIYVVRYSVSSTIKMILEVRFFWGLKN